VFCGLDDMPVSGGFRVAIIVEVRFLEYEDVGMFVNV
jgi:hypothetical protein